MKIHVRQCNTDTENTCPQLLPLEATRGTPVIKPLNQDYPLRVRPTQLAFNLLPSGRHTSTCKRLISRANEAQDDVSTTYSFTATLEKQ